MPKMREKAQLELYSGEPEALCGKSEMLRANSEVRNDMGSFWRHSSA